MCFKKWFGKEEVIEEIPVERKPVDELVQNIKDLIDQLNLVIEDNKKLEEHIKMMENEKQQDYEAACKAKEQVVDLLNEKAELERRLEDIENLAKGK